MQAGVRKKKPVVSRQHRMPDTTGFFHTGSGSADAISYMQGTGSSHDESEADLVKAAEYHELTGFFVRQPDQLVAFPAMVSAGDQIRDRLTGLVDVENGACVDAFAFAAIDDDDLMPENFESVNAIAALIEKNA